MKKKRYACVLIVVFVAIYIFSMIAATVLAKEKQEYKFLRIKDFALEDIRLQMESINSRAIDGEVYSKEYIEDYILYTLSTVYWWSDDASQKISVAVYDEEGNKITKSTRTLLLYGTDAVYAFELDKYFSEEEIEFIEQIYFDREKIKEGAVTPYWRVHAYVNEETAELAKVYFTTEYNFDVSEADYETPNTETKWSWINPDKTVHENLVAVGDTIHSNYNIIIPYLDLGEQENDVWMQHDFMQEYPEKCTDLYEGPFRKNNFKESYYEYDDILCVGDKEFIFKYRHMYEPWTTTIDSLKGFYVWSALFMVLCAAIVIENVNKYQKQRELLEETRRDFTNAIAHELKTPLGVIRGFAENMLENVNETKRNYYLKRIIGQTEEIDALVKEMVYISQLDSVETNLEKERLSIEKIVKNQLEKLEVLADEKNLTIKLKINNDFEVWGVEKYLERAIWNVLHNAIEYNHLDGFIKITIDSTRLIIENSGVQIKEDEFPHIFDMFYTSDKSRNFSEKHMGLGLYLAKKILELHKMNISIGNTDTGVEVVINM